MPIGGVGSISVSYSDREEDTVQAFCPHLWAEPVVVVWISVWVFLILSALEQGPSAACVVSGLRGFECKPSRWHISSRVYTVEVTRGAGQVACCTIGVLCAAEKS